MKDRTEIEHIVLRIRDLMSRSKRVTFTVEHGRGETYATADWTLYAHDRYPRSSVLCGKERRSWLAQFGEGEDGLKRAMELCAAAGILRRTQVYEGTSWVPVEQIVSHLPDDTD